MTERRQDYPNIQERLDAVDKQMDILNKSLSDCLLEIRVTNASANKLIEHHDTAIKRINAILDGNGKIGLRTQVDRIEQRGALVWSVFVGVICLVAKEIWEFLMRGAK